MRNKISYTSAISDLGNFEILTPKNPKKHNFWKNCHKKQNFQNFQKTGIYVTEA